MTNPSTNTPTMNWSQIVKIAAGSVAFGVLMSIRHETDQMWIRAVLAACAALALGTAILSAVGRKT